MSHSSRSHVVVAKSALVAAAVLFGAYWLLFGWLVISGPLTYAELDLNHDGEVSFSEADYAASYGKRAITVRNQQCTEYFAYKDGLQLKVICPTPA
jgi:hypothetical protein